MISNVNLLLGGCDQIASARQRALSWGASWSSWTAAPEGGTHSCARPIRVAVHSCESDRVKIKGRGAGLRPNVESAGTATLHRQHLQGARVEPAEEVACATLPEPTVNLSDRSGWVRALLAHSLPC